ncbi:GNAT family N-acetyltransferase [Marinicella sp. W31]|uniref:GNAT family N-acetyltransferase n=1 Tax=Marinicella sp. W31 TaxID=3023713 RepID=UPI003756D43B
MHIIEDDLSGQAIHRLLQEHLDNMAEISPPESTHALDLDGLKQPDVTFWTLWENQELLGCGALKELDPQHGEIKSMRTATAHLRKGVARFVLEHILRVAKQRGYNRLSLETGSMNAFKPAHHLYQTFGFIECAPFAEYIEDPNSLFMTKQL